MFWTALPIRDAIWLCVRDRTGTRPVREIPSGTNAPVTLGNVAVSTHGYAAVFAGTMIHIVPPDDSLPYVIRLPDDLVGVHCVHFRDELLYIGGSSSWQDTSRLGWIDVTNHDDSWHPLDPPPVVGDAARPVYAIFSRGDRLYALDGAFTPKLALVYDISAPRAPRYVEYAAVASGLDDRPIHASIGRSYAAILSVSQQAQGKAWKIAILDTRTMDEIATFYEHSANADAIENPHRVLVYDDLLLIAHDHKGIGIARLDDRSDTRYKDVPTIHPWAQSYIPLHRLTYHKPLGQGRVLDVRPTSDPHLFYVVLQRGGRSWWEEIEVR